MASEQQQPARAARLADPAAFAALCAAQPERYMPDRDPVVTEVQIITPGSAADLSHASAGAALAHAKRSHYAGGKKQKDTIEKEIPDIKDYDAHVASQLSWEGAASALRDHRAVAAPSATLPKPTCYVPGRGSLEETHRDTGHERALTAASGAFTNSIKRTGTVPGASPAPADRSTRRAHLDDQDTLDNWAEASRISHVASTNAQRYASTPSSTSRRLAEHDKKNIEHAAAVSMAQSAIYTSREKEDQRLDMASLYGAQNAPGRTRTNRASTVSDTVALQQAINLQYAAQKLAAERIAEMNTDADYQQYYGTESQPVRSRLSVRRKRASSMRETSNVDMERSMAIRTQMSSLQHKLHAVDEQRQKDRDSLMEAARKNVDAVIHDMELKVFADTGRPPSSVPKKMEPTPHERAVSETELEYADKVYIGTGQYIDEADLEAAAWANVRPTLDQMDDQVAEQRAKEIERRMEKDEKKRQHDLEREREASIKSQERKKAHDHDEEKRHFHILPAIGHRAKRKEEQEKGSKEEELRAREVEKELDKEQRKRQRSIEREREADTRAVEKQIIRENREEEEERRLSRRKSNRVSERKPSAEREESTRAEERAPSLERDSTAVAGVPPAATGSEPESQIEASASSRAAALPEMTRSQTAEGQTVNVLPETEAGSGVATTSAKPESKLRTWFKDRLGRHPREEPKVSTEGEKGKAPGPTGGAALVTAEDSRGAALSSHPVTGVELAQMQNGGTNGDGDFGQSSTAEDLHRPLSEGEKSLPNGEHRRSRFRNSLMRIVSRNSQEPKANGISAHDEDTRRHSTAEEYSHHDDQGHHDALRHADAEREDLRESAAEQGLAAPPAIGEQGSYSTARESRFSEDL